MEKMPQNDSVAPFTIQIFLHGNFTVSLEGGKTYLDGIYIVFLE